VSRTLPTRFGRVHFRAAGRGPAIVLLHINRQSSALYLELLEALCGEYHVIAPDFPGYGHSDPLDAPPSISDYADGVRALLDVLGIERATIVGEAVGAAVAVEFAVRYPAATAGIVLINCPLMADSDAAAAVIGSARARAGATHDCDDETFISRHGQHAPLDPSPSWVARVRDAHRQCGDRCWEAADALLAYNLRATLSCVNGPVLLLSGEFSPFVGFIPELRRLLPGARAHVIARSRFGIGWEKAEEVAQRISEFYAREITTPART
jgi:pimeloyl-ACP methyl ester carboxylesterase